VSAYGPAVLICNLRGRDRARVLSEVRAHLERRELECDIRTADRPGEATRLARLALEEGARLLVAVGDDGTVRDVVNGMMCDDRARVPEAVLGVVAGGAGCDFIKTFGIPPNPAHAVAHLDGPESFPIDVGKVTCVRADRNATSYFCNLAEVGLGASVTSTAARLPMRLGPARYLLSLWLRAPLHRRAEVVVDLVDRTYEGPMSSMIVANGQFLGGMKVAPRAAPTDGLLDVLIGRASRVEEIALAPKVFRGEHLPHPDIKLAKRVRVSIEADRPLPVSVDGAVLGHTPATFEVLSEAIRLKV
jgi:diacylglycerol kinase (ATP)